MNVIKLILVLLFSFSLSASYAQPLDIVVPFLNGGKWGFMNKEKEIIVCPKYDEAFPPQYNRARVRLGDKYGFIDMNGEVVIEIKYDEADDFSVIARVRKKNNEYYIKRDGTKFKSYLSSCMEVDDCLSPHFSERIAIVRDNAKYGLMLNTAYKSDSIIMIPAEYDTIAPITHQLMYFLKDSIYTLNHEGFLGAKYETRIRTPRVYYNSIQFFKSDCDQRWHRIFGVRKAGLWGFIDAYGWPGVIVDPKYLTIWEFKNDFAWVEYSENKFGYIDAYGNEYFIR